MVIVFCRGGLDSRKVMFTTTEKPGQQQNVSVRILTGESELEPEWTLEAIALLVNGNVRT